MNTADKYYSKLNKIATDVIDAGLSASEIFDGDKWNDPNSINQLIEMRQELTIEDDLEKATPYLETGILQGNDNDYRLIAICVILDIEHEIQRIEQCRLCEPYSESHPLLIKCPCIERRLYPPDVKVVKDLIDLHGLNTDDTYQLFSIGAYKARISSELHPNVVEFILSEFPDKKSYFRLDPYRISERLKPRLVETIQRPADPYWWKTLKIYDNHRKSSIYTLSEQIDHSWEYRIRGIRRLEVVWTNRKGCLSLMAEELRYISPTILLGRCIHLTVDTIRGKTWESALVSHIDGAINVYFDNDCESRLMSSLTDGKSTDATIRTHLFKVLEIPLNALIPISMMFFKSNILTYEWIEDQFL